MNNTTQSKHDLTRTTADKREAKPRASAKGLTLRTAVKAGNDGRLFNHNETMVAV